VPLSLVLPVKAQDCLFIEQNPVYNYISCEKLQDEEACDIFQAVLGAYGEKEPSFVPTKMQLNSPMSRPVRFQDLDEALVWKKNIISIISRIFSHLCEPVGPDMAYTVGRILEYYLVTTHKKDPDLPRTPSQSWTKLTEELNSCMMSVVNSRYHFSW